MMLGGAVAAMTEALRHRGPDGHGFLAMRAGLRSADLRTDDPPEGEGTLFFGHRRLSIIDLAGSAQPLCNEDGSVWTVFNGEIYNYREIASGLAAKGHVLRDKGDTEVLVHLWEDRGEAMLDELVGMFAFAIYDSAKDILFLARDRFGQKPLYCMEAGGLFAFASEIQALWTLESFPCSDIDPAAMACYFKYGFIPSPMTAYRGVRSLPAGSCLVRRNGISSERRYWKPCVRGLGGAADLDRLESALDDSVKLQLRSDVPLGAFLSGGIDSALVTASMARNLEGKVRTFTVGTGRNWFDESEEARMTAAHLATEHHEIKVDPDFADASRLLARHYGQPFADHSSILTYYVSRETRRFVKVALSGDGGDELFGGYGSYTNSGLYKIVGLIPQAFRSAAASLLKAMPFGGARRQYLPDSIMSACSPPEKGENIACLFHDHWRKLCFTEDFKRELAGCGDNTDVFTSFYSGAPSSDAAEKWMETDQLLYLPDDILVKVDAASMAVSLECRAPFLDHRLAEYANSIPAREKLKDGTTKHLLRRLAGRRLPAKIANLPKKGFSMPLGKWIRDDLKDWMHALVFGGAGAWQRYLDRKAVAKLWEEHQRGAADHQSRLWAVAEISLWTECLRQRKTKVQVS